MRPTALVTDVSNALGTSCATELAYRGYTVFVVGGINPTSLVDSIRIKTSNENVFSIGNSLVSVQEAKDLARVAEREMEQLDLLIHTKAFDDKFSLLKEENPSIFSHYHLIPLTLNLELKSTLACAAQSRIVHIHSKELVRGFVDIENSDGLGMSTHKCYRNSQLWSYLSMKELAKSLEGSNITVNSVYPGPVVDYRFDFKAKIWELISPLPRTPHYSAQLPVWIAIAPQLNGVSGKLFDTPTSSPSAQIKFPKENDLKRVVWDKSLSLITAASSGPGLKKVEGL